MPEGDEKDKATAELDALRFVGFGIDTQKLSNIEDHLSNISNTLLATGGVEGEDLPKFVPSWRPNNPLPEPEVEEVIDFRVKLKQLASLGAT